MPQLYLHIHDGKELIQDDVGANFHGVEEARREAVSAAQEIACKSMLTRRRLRNWAFEITDQDGKVLLRVPFKDAFVSLHTRAASCAG